MTEERVLFTPRKSSPPAEKGSPLFELAALATSFVHTPQNQQATNLNSFKNDFSPAEKVDSKSSIGVDRLKTKLNFDDHDMDLCSSLAILRSSPRKPKNLPRRKGRKATIVPVIDQLPKLEKKIKSRKQKPKKQRKINTANRKKRKNEWNDKEIIILLQVTKIMIDCELKSVAKALFECIERSPGKSYGRAAEKKLKRMEIFENWKKCDKDKIIGNIQEKLKSLGVSKDVVDPRVIKIANKYREQELGHRVQNRIRTKRSISKLEAQPTRNVKPKFESTFITLEIPFAIGQCIETIIQTLEIDTTHNELN